MKIISAVSIGIAGILSASFVSAQELPKILINELAWMGSESSYYDEWIELRNTTDSEISIEGWVLRTEDGSLEIKLAGAVPPNGFWLLERTDDDSAPLLPADQIYSGTLGNEGEKLVLSDQKGTVTDSMDCSSGWPAGDNSSKQTMERIKGGGWQTSRETGGTPKAKNSEGAKIPEENGREEAQNNQYPCFLEGKVLNKNLIAVPVALILAAFSGAVILTLKKNLKKG